MSRSTSRRALALALPAALATLLATAVAPAASAASTGSTEGVIKGHAPRDVLTGKPSDGTHTVVTPVDRSNRPLSGSVARGSRQPGLYRSTSVLSTWEFKDPTSLDSNPDAKAAFQRAMDTWAHTVASSVPIVVDAHLMSFQDPAQLGGAGPTSFWGTRGVVAYPIALANAIDGTDNQPGQADIDAYFSSDSSEFYYGADPAGIATASCTVYPATTPTQGSCYDFESVVLHELGHGLGFLGSVGDQDSQGNTIPIQYGLEDPGSGSTTPTIFDEFTETRDGRPILDYPNSSTELANAVRSNAVYWFGGYGSSADRGREPRLFAPSTWLEGSSYSHLSDASYPLADPDSLMTPYADAGDITRDPGEVMLGMFRDMGWVTPGLPGGKYTPLTPTRVLDTGPTTKVGNGGTRDISIGGHFGVPADATAVVLNVTSAVPSSADVVTVYPYPRDPSSAIVPASTNLNTATGNNRANLVTVPLSQRGPTGASGSGIVRLRNVGGATRLVADLAGYYEPASATYFHALSPTRVMDTRGGLGVPKAKIGRGGVVDLTLAGKSIPSGATSVAFELTAVKPTASTYVSVYPTGTTKTTSSINLATGTIASNQVIVKIGTGGKIRFYNFNGAIDLVADLAGYYDTDPNGGTLFRPTLPQQTYDSGDNVAPKIGPGRIATFALKDDYYGVPTSATSAVVNVTGLQSTAATYLTAYPAGTARPTASNVNLVKGQNAASLATVRLPSSGVIAVYNQGGYVVTHVDLQGWFGP